MLNLKSRFLLPTLLIPILFVVFICLYLVANYPLEFLLGRIRGKVFPKSPLELTETREMLIQKGLEIPLKNPRIEVHKGERSLILYDQDQIVQRFTIGLGPNPLGTKAKEGDGKTPEGEYLICSRLNPTSLHLFLGLNYPTTEDVNRSTLLLSDMDKTKIETATISHRQPPWNTPLGGAIGIHGGGDISDWTAGCIGVSNQNIEILYLLTEIGTPVRILP